MDGLICHSERWVWNERFKHLARELLLGGPALSKGQFAEQLEQMVDCRRLGFRDGAEAGREPLFPWEAKVYAMVG